MAVPEQSYVGEGATIRLAVVNKASACHFSEEGLEPEAWGQVYKPSDTTSKVSIILINMVAPGNLYLYPKLQMLFVVFSTCHHTETNKRSQDLNGLLLFLLCEADE